MEWVTYITSDADPDPFHSRLPNLDPTPAQAPTLYKTSQNTEKNNKLQKFDNFFTLKT